MKRKAKNIWLIVLGTAVFIAAGVVVIVYSQNFAGRSDREFWNSVLLGSGIVILGAALLSLILLLVTNQVSKINELAFMNTRYQIQNENAFARICFKRLKKGAESYIVACYPALLKDQLVLQLGYEKVETVIDTLAGLLKKHFTGSTALCAYHSQEFFLLYVEDTAAGLAQRIESFEKEFATSLVERGIFSKIVLAYGAIEATRKEPMTDLIQKANRARLAVSSEEKSGQLAFYDESIFRESESEAELRKDIDRALLAEEFEVFYQPKFDFRLSRFVGAEALIKWNHPLKGTVHAGGFIPYAEKSNQIVALDRYIFRHVCADIVSWKKRGVRLLPISINLSRNDAYQSDLITFIKSSLAEFGVSPQLIEIELTESAISKDMLYIGKVLKDIRELGIKTDMDDFGTGYSSLSMLYKLPLDVMKIDKSFFDNVEIDKKAREIVKSMINVGKTCGLAIVAEGIENEKQLAFLRTTKCDYIQGNYFSPSISKSQYEKLLKSNRFERKESKI